MAEGMSLSWLQADINDGTRGVCSHSESTSCVLQRAPCGLPLSTEQTFTTEAEQDERLMFLAELIDADIKAHLLNDPCAAKWLTHQLSDSPFIQVVAQSPHNGAAS